jgi:transcriptional regulator with XRE-family HTH domain
MRRYLQRLRVLRAGTNLSQVELARRLGWSATTLWRIEHGYRETSAIERRALAEFFGVAEDEIWPSSGESE